MVIREKYCNFVDDHDNLTVLPLEIKSGKDYTAHSALTNFLDTSDYGINRAVVFSNERKIFKKNGVTYLPIYYNYSDDFH